jgi:hypothetical protein
VRFPGGRARRSLGRVWREADPVVDLFDPGRARCFPEDYDATAGYQEAFTDTARVFDLFMKRCVSIRSVDRGTSVAIVVMPWFASPTPWFSIAIGLALAQRGRSVTFVWHDLPVPEPSAQLEVQRFEIRRMMRKLSRRFRVVRLSAQLRARSESGDEALLDQLAEANLTWHLRGASPTEEDTRFGLRIRDNLAGALPFVRSLVRESGFTYVVVPGGVSGPSGLYLAAGRAERVRVATFDAGLGALAVNTDGIAAQHTDMARAFELLTADPEGRHDDVIRAAREEFDRRRSGLDPDRYQFARPTDMPAEVEQGVLIPLSVVFDAAALGLHELFVDSEEWLVETVSALLRETRKPIVVRQHPSERRSGERSRFDARTILRDAFGTSSQVRFVAAEDDVSTYDLLDASQLVLPFASTIGIEAAALGKTVIVSGAVYYAGLGFVRAPSSREEYFDLLGRGARGELPTLTDQVDRAWRCYYLTAVCQRVWTNFTPQPADFWRWVARQPDELFRDPDVDDILTSIDEDVPLAIVRHRRRVQSGWSAASTK